MMAGYIDPVSVASEARVSASGFTDKTTPSLIKVTEIIGEVEAEVDLILGARFQLPLVSNSSLLFIRAICLALAAERVRNISPIGAPGDQNPFAAAAKNARARLDAVSRGLFFLDGEVAGGGTDIGVAYSSRRCGENYFRRGVDQW